MAVDTEIEIATRMRPAVHDAEAALMRDYASESAYEDCIRGWSQDLGLAAGRPGVGRLAREVQDLRMKITRVQGGKHGSSR